MLLVAAGLILGSVIGAGFLLRRIITRPLASLGREAEQVAAGDFEKPVAIATGPREIVELGGEIDAMRRRIVHELTTVEAAHRQLEGQALELKRSNTELEQFAYVASHDLQEPLRKVASFCQALERRYHGQLDERADQYIDFAVDGAKRMQVLINDLLAFSRVGRSGAERELVDLEDVLDRGPAIALAGARGGIRDRAGRSAAARARRAHAARVAPSEPDRQRRQVPRRRAARVRLAARREDDLWHFSCADNGIGIDPEYAERIFVIFQRLHTKEAYPGTGIGLAMCRKIVEYHGGRMWLDRDHSPGARFQFTLPIAEEDKP